ncbi:MAG: serine/threonine-protein phosphatase [Muribaculaceae bacterium]|nr:serine/threonine-protein phosphatase [Muribaculaceae bacterium]
MKLRISKPIAIVQKGKRDNQEDSIFPAQGVATESDNCFIVCDGMGGHERGEVASATVADALGKFVVQNFPGQGEFSTSDFSKALNVAYDALDEIIDEGDTSSKKPGTTLTFIKLHNGGVMIAHIGDSRIYHISPSRNAIWRTRDHSIVEDLYRMGEIEEHQMRTHPRRNIITKVMQPRAEEGRTKATLENVTDIVEGDYFMLCSDGIVERHDDNTFLKIFSDNSLSDEQKAQRIEEITADNADNHCAYIFKVIEVEGAEAQPSRNKSAETEKQNHSLLYKWGIWIVMALAVLALVYLITKFVL